MKSKQQTGWAKWKCNKCHRIFDKDLGCRTWVKTLCGENVSFGRLYRISEVTKKAPKKKNQ
jgi:PHP family Zn ribbon phosphoesterase